MVHGQASRVVRQRNANHVAVQGADPVAQAAIRDIFSGQGRHVLGLVEPGQFQVALPGQGQTEVAAAADIQGVPVGDAGAPQNLSGDDWTGPKTPLAMRSNFWAFMAISPPRSFPECSVLGSMKPRGRFAK